MAQPPVYNRQKNFADDFGNETDHSALNAELDRASNSINDIRFNLAILQADDGKLRPSVVTSDSISMELRTTLVEGVVMDAQAMLDRSLTAADVSSASSRSAKASEDKALECKTAAAQLATAAQQSAKEAAESASKAKQVNADWNAADGYAQILNKPKTLASLELADIQTRIKSAVHSIGDVVIAPYIHDAILVCTTAGITSNEELCEDVISIGADITDGTVIWNIRKKFSVGLKRVEGSISLDTHSSQTAEFGLGNEQYFGHVKVIDNCFSNKTAADSVALSPLGTINAINNAMLGKNAGVFTESATWSCPISGTYEITLVGGGGGGGGGGDWATYTYRANGIKRTYYGTGGGGGGGGAAAVTTVHLALLAGESLQITIAAGGVGGGMNSNGGNGGITSLTKFALDGSATEVIYTANGGKGGSAGVAGTAGEKGGFCGAGGPAGISMMDASQATGGATGNRTPLIGGAGGNGAWIAMSSIYSRFGNGGGGGYGNGQTAGTVGSANELATGGQGITGGNGAQGMAYIDLYSI